MALSLEPSFRNVCSIHVPDSPQVFGADQDGATLALVFIAGRPERKLRRAVFGLNIVIISVTTNKQIGTPVMIMAMTPMYVAPFASVCSGTNRDCSLSSAT